MRPCNASGLELYQNNENSSPSMPIKEINTQEEKRAASGLRGDLLEKSVAESPCSAHINSTTAEYKSFSHRNNKREESQPGRLCRRVVLLCGVDAV